MPAIHCRAPSALREGGLGGLLRTNITRWSAPAVSCVGRRKASGVRPGGAPVRQLVYFARRGCGPGLMGQRQFVWWRQAAEHSLNGPVGGYPSPLAKPAAWFRPSNGLWIASVRPLGGGLGRRREPAGGDRQPVPVCIGACLASWPTSSTLRVAGRDGIHRPVLKHGPRSLTRVQAQGWQTQLYLRGAKARHDGYASCVAGRGQLFFFFFIEEKERNSLHCRPIRILD